MINTFSFGSSFPNVQSPRVAVLNFIFDENKGEKKRLDISHLLDLSQTANVLWMTLAHIRVCVFWTLLFNR